MTITRESLPRKWMWSPDELKGSYVILRGDGGVYDAYEDRQTALRVLSDLTSRYGDGYAVAEVV